MNPRSNKLKKVAAILVTIVHVNTQVVFAGVPFQANPVFALDQLGLKSVRLKALSLAQKIAAKGIESGRVIFHAFPYGAVLDPRGRTDLPEESQIAPERLNQQEDKQMSILRQLEELQIFQTETFQNRPKLPGSSADILDSMSTYKLNTTINREMKRVQEDRNKTATQMEQEIEDMRRAINGAGGSMRRQLDGSRWFFLHGLLVSIRGQRYKDGNGNLTLVDTRRIKYDKDKRLQRGYTRITTDSQGNVSVSIRTDITYTPESNEHGNQIVTSYKDTNMDPNGNISTIERNNITYLEGPNVEKKQRGQYVTSYDEVETDQYNNKTTRRWENGKYIKLGENFYLTDYDLTETDADKNKTKVEWRGATYVHNPYYQKLKTINSTRQEYLLTTYTQQVTAANGLVHTEIWRGAQYDTRDNLVSFDQTNTNPTNTLPTEIQFRKGTYDRYGRQAGFERTEITADGARVKITRLDTGYNKLGDIISSTELVSGNGGYLTRTDRYGIEYNRKRQQIAYKETLLDQGGGLIEKTWSALQAGLNKEAVAEFGEKGYDARGRLIGFEEKMTADSLTETKLTTNITFDATGARASSLETTHTTGVLEGADVDVTHIVDTKRLDTQYGDDGQVTSYQDEILDWGQDNNKNGMILRDLKIALMRTNITTDGFLETRTTTGGEKRPEGERALETINAVVQTKQEHTVYDGSNRVHSYDQVTKEYQDAGRPKTTTSHFSDLLYDPAGRLLHSKEVGVVGYDDNLTPPYNVETVRDGISYDAFDRVAGAVTTTRTTTPGTDITVVAARSSVRYNGMGDISKYREAVVSSASPNLTETTDWQGKEYSVLGRLHHSIQTERSTGTDGDSVIDNWRTTETTDMVYDDSNRLTGFNESIRGSDATGVVTHRTVDGITYDSREHQLILHETTHREGPGVDETSSITRLPGDIIRDGDGIIRGYSETFSNADGVELTNKHENVDWTVWGINDQIRSRRTITNSNDAQAVFVTTDYNAQFDITGRVISTGENIDRSGDILDVQTNRSVVNTYNKLGQVLTRDEISETDGVVITTRQTTSYDKEGRAKDSTDHVVTEGKLPSGEPYRREQTTHTVDTFYDSVTGRSNGFIQDVVSADSPDLVTRTTRTDVAYNLKGQQTGYKDVVHEKGGDLDHETTTLRSDIRYDLGRTTHYVDTSFDGTEKTSDELTRIATVDTLFNNDGLATEIKRNEVETGDAINHTRETVKTITGFTDQGLETNYVETITDNLTPNVTETVTRSGVVITNGMLDTYSETSVKVNATDGWTHTMATDHTQLDYDSFARLIKDVSKETDTFGVPTDRTHEQHYDSTGRIRDTTDETHRYDGDLDLTTSKRAVTARRHIRTKGKRSITISYRIISKSR
jgi:hypothetical protein